MKNEILPYKPHLKEIAKQLRQNMTLSEVLLWNELKQKKIQGYDFDRQKPILNYIVDFYCKDLKLAIEIDGNSHDNNFENDLIRQKEIECLGVSFIRFTDISVKTNIQNCIAEINNWIINSEELNQK